ncbi:MAG: hypothetical protein MSS87_05590, partial [Bacteroidales bacterium]|nr:hypothetical protein [Bacteroidales bacterium]
NCRTCFIISKGQKRLSCASLGFCPFGGEQSLFQSLEVEYPVTDVQIESLDCRLGVETLCVGDFATFAPNGILPHAVLRK